MFIVFVVIFLFLILISWDVSPNWSPVPGLQKIVSHLRILNSRKYLRRRVSNPEHIVTGFLRDIWRFYFKFILPAAEGEAARNVPTQYENVTAFISPIEIGQHDVWPIRRRETHLKNVLITHSQRQTRTAAFRSRDTPRDALRLHHKKWVNFAQSKQF